MSNLLAVGYRRLSLDVFWDSSRRVWSLCPAEISNSTTSSSTSNASFPRTVHKRQAIVGQYSCSSTLTLDAFGNLLVDYLGATSTNLEARMIFVTLSVNVASPSSGTLQRLNSTQLPNSDQEINDILKDLSGDIYTPERLQNERLNLNASWLGTPESSKPDLMYLNTSIQSDNILTTQNGWPNAGLIAFQKRLIIALGPVDDAMAGYNFTNDFRSYFNTSAITNLPTVAMDPTGSISNGCLYDSSNTNNALTSQWATYSNINLTSSNQSSTIPTVSNLTLCGISPFVNDTLDFTADSLIAPHISLIMSSIWSWAPGEPRNITSMDSNADRLRCAVQDLSHDGRWRLADCTNNRHGACRSNSNPLDWSFTSSRGTYQSRDRSCPSGTTFAVPRTALENRYLAASFSRYRSSQPANSESASDPGPWVDFNSMNAKNCWVMGASSTCPYQGGPSTSRQIVIPIVAAVIVLVIAALFLFVKCAANRSNTRRGRRRKGRDDHGEYEGVPS